MIISKKSQLGLMFDELHIQKIFYQLQIDRVKHLRDIVTEGERHDDGTVTLKVPEEDIEYFKDLPALSNQIELSARIKKFFTDAGVSDIGPEGTRWYLIRDSVEYCSKMVHLGDNFSTRAFRNVRQGKHTYLLGEHEMARFLCYKGYLQGFYFNTADKVVFDFGFDLANEGYFFDTRYSKYFNKIAKIITFVELGDVEVTILEQGKNNGKSKKDGKLTNQSDFKMYVVDTSWNKLIIRTEGFAVRGHFRLQACGEGFMDRKVIWINAFEKQGYVRQPKNIKLRE